MADHPGRLPEIPEDMRESLGMNGLEISARTDLSRMEDITKASQDLFVAKLQACEAGRQVSNFWESRWDMLSTLLCKAELELRLFTLERTGQGNLEADPMFVERSERARTASMELREWQSPILLGTYRVQGSWRSSSQVYTIPAELAQRFFDGKKEDIVLYRRPAVGRLSTWLSQKTDGSYKLITGPPGIGKSTNTFGILVCDSVQYKRVIWWIKWRTDFAMRIRGTQVEVFVRSDCLKFLDDADVIVLDQHDCFHRKQTETLDDYCTCRTKPVSVVYVGSVEECTPEFHVPEWTLAEYMQALENAKIRNRFSRMETYHETVAREKFYYAGISARYMFSLSIEEICEDLASSVSYARNHPRNLLQLWQRCWQRPSEIFYYSTVNRSRGFTSGYVADKVCESRPLMWFRQVVEFLRLQGSSDFYGHMFAMFVMAKIREGIVMFDWKFLKQNITIEYLRVTDVHLDQWLRPQSWKYSGFDLVWIHRTRGHFHTAIFLQTDLCYEHDVKSQALLECLRDISHDTIVINRIEILLVVPDVHSTFTLKEGSYGDLIAYDSRWGRKKLPIRKLVVQSPEAFYLRPNVH